MDAPLYGLLGLAVLIVFGQSAWFDFVDFDDPLYLKGHDHVRGGPTGANLLWGLTTLHLANWHPLTWWSWQLDTLIWGYGPRGFHITNVLLHLLNTCLVYRVVRQWSAVASGTGRGDRIGAFLIALLFAIHPLRWESVGWISERKGLLSGLFALLALDRYHAFVRRPGAARMATVALCLALSLMSKSMAVTFPCVLLLLDWFPYRRWNQLSDLRKLVLEKWPLWLLVVGSCVVTFFAQNAGGAVRTLEQVPLAYRFTNAAWAYLTYVRQTIWPANLCLFYPYGRPRPVGQYVVVFAVLSGLTGGAILLRRRLPAVTAGWLCFLGMLVPVIGLVQVGVAAHADRYTYLPQIGLLIAIGSLLNWAADRLLTVRGCRLLAGSFVAVLGVASVLQGRTWRDGRASWTQAALACPCEANWCELGNLEIKARRYEDAAKAFEEACRHFPPGADLWASLATAHRGAQRVREAEQAAHHSMSLETFATPDSRASCDLVLGEAAERRGDREEATLRYLRGLKQTGQYWIAADLGTNLVRVGEAKQAIPLLEAHCRQFPDSAELRQSLAGAYMGEGQWPRAAETLEKAVELSPKEPKLRSQWVTALVASGQRDRARAEATALLRLDPKWPAGAIRAADRMTTQKSSRSILEEGYWLVSAVSLVSEPPPAELLGVMATGAEGMGRHDEALALAEQALAAARANGQTHLIEIISARRAEWRARSGPSTQ